MRANGTQEWSESPERLLTCYRPWLQLRDIIYINAFRHFVIPSYRLLPSSLCHKTSAIYPYMHSSREDAANTRDWSSSWDSSLEALWAQNIPRSIPSRKREGRQLLLRRTAKRALMRSPLWRVIFALFAAHLEP